MTKITPEAAEYFGKMSVARSPIEAAEPRTPMNARCGDCDHVWTIAWLPMPLDRAAIAMQRATCPMCASTKVFVA